MTTRFLIAGFAINLLGISSSFALDGNLPAYQTAPGITGHIKAVGSDTLDKEMIGWAKGFMALYPDVKIEIEGKGSATAPPALTEGISQLGPMSRGMSGEEIAKFEKKYGYTASNFRIAVDALAVYVNKANPVECLTLQQVNRIFSTSRVAAFGGDIKTWGETGLGGEWANKPISLFGRNSISAPSSFSERPR